MVLALLQFEHAFLVTVPGWGTFLRFGGFVELLLPAKSSVPLDSGVELLGPLVDALLSPMLPCGRKIR